MSIVQPNTANIATTMNNNSHMLSTNNAENSSGSSSRNEHNYAPNPSKFTNDAEYYRYVMNQLSGKGRASSSTDISKPARYYNNNQMNSNDPFVEDSSGRSTGIENEYWGNNNLEVSFSVYQNDWISRLKTILFQEDGNAEEDAEDEEGPFPYASFMVLSDIQCKENSLILVRTLSHLGQNRPSRKLWLARRSQTRYFLCHVCSRDENWHKEKGVVDSTYGSDKGKTVVRYYDRPNVRRMIIKQYPELIHASHDFLVVIRLCLRRLKIKWRYVNNHQNRIISYFPDAS